MLLHLDAQPHILFMMPTRVILEESEDRFVLFPIKYPEVWSLYKEALASFWTAEEVDLGKDMKDWLSLTNPERGFVKHVLAFFAASDGIVVENLAARFCQEVQIPEVRCFYGFQMMMENIHSETYALLLQTYVHDQHERDLLFHSMQTVPTISEKARWTRRWISDDAPFAQRLLAFAIVEGVFFSSSFAAIFWLKKRGLMPGLTYSNELICRDEGLHTRFACLLLREFTDLPSELVARGMMIEAVFIEHKFIDEALPEPLFGINADQMTDYVSYVADYLLTSLGYKKIFNSTNPFDFMEMISLQGKTNFFEKRVSDYSKAHVGRPSAGKNMAFSTNEDF